DLLSLPVAPRTLVGHRDPIISCTFSPNGAYVLTGAGDGTARLWDMSGAELRSLDDGPGGLLPIFSPDSQHVLPFDEDYLARLWTVDGVELPPFAAKAPPKDRMFTPQVAFSTNGRSLMVTVYDGSARVWDIDGRLLMSIECDRDTEMRYSLS